MKRKGFFNIYLTATISVSLVLCLVGIECAMLLSAKELIRHVKENMVFTIVLNDSTSTDQVTRMATMLDRADFALDYRYISREQALQEHIDNLGEDPEKFLGFNPLTDAFEVHLKESYAQSDSIESIKQALMTLPYVDKVVYQEDVVKVLDNNVSEASLILMAVGLALLLIAVVLIANTIQLQIYSKRFIINTMRLVGATPWVIKWPFIKRNLIMGIEAGSLASITLAGAYWYALDRLGVFLFQPTWQNISFVIGIVMLGGLIITFLSSWLATNIFIRMKVNKMYEI